MNGRTVKTFDIPVTVNINEWDMDDGSHKYDWWADNGDDSAELFDTAKEAEDDARRRFR